MLARHQVPGTNPREAPSTLSKAAVHQRDIEISQYIQRLAWLRMLNKVA
jgi:hypothetical protein